MNVFLAGGSGAIGRVLVPMLLARGHRVVAMTRSAERAEALRQLGAEPVLGDVYDEDGLRALMQATRPELVMHQLTAFGATTADPLAETIRVRTEGTRKLVAAAQAAGARRLITQSISFLCTPHGEGLTDEATPLYTDSGPAIKPLADAIASLEQQTQRATGLTGQVLRYGWFYGPGTNFDAATGLIVRGLRKGRLPVVGGGTGVYSHIALQDAARATLAAIAHDAPGLYNIVDDDPARQSEWLPAVAGWLGAPAPAEMDAASARPTFGDLALHLMTEQRGASNALARRELGWAPQVPSWREGLRQLYAGASL